MGPHRDLNPDLLAQKQQFYHCATLHWRDFNFFISCIICCLSQKLLIFPPHCMTSSDTRLPDLTESCDDPPRIFQTRWRSRRRGWQTKCETLTWKLQNFGQDFPRKQYQRSDRPSLPQAQSLSFSERKIFVNCAPFHKFGILNSKISCILNAEILVV